VGGGWKMPSKSAWRCPHSQIKAPIPRDAISAFLWPLQLAPCFEILSSTTAVMSRKRKGVMVDHKDRRNEKCTKEACRRDDSLDMSSQISETENMCWISYWLQGSGQLKKLFFVPSTCCCSSFAYCTTYPDTTSSPYFQSLSECS